MTGPATTSRGGRQADSAVGRLLAKLDLAFPYVGMAAEQIWGGSDVRASYPIYLRAMHSIVRSAVPLLLAARDRALELAPDDPLAGRLVDYFERHAREESGHDLWLLEDLAMLGAPPRAALERFPSASAAELAGAQYYWIRHYHPVTLLGHIAALECYHPADGFSERLRRLTGYPREAFRTIERHQRIDIHHKRDLLALIDSLPLTPAQEEAVALSGLHTFSCAVNVLRGIRPPASTGRRSSLLDDEPGDQRLPAVPAASSAQWSADI